MIIFIIQVHDPVIHLEVDEEQCRKLKIQPLHGITVLFKLITMQGRQNATIITKGTIS